MKLTRLAFLFIIAMILFGGEGGLVNVTQPWLVSVPPPHFNPKIMLIKIASVFRKEVFLFDNICEIRNLNISSKWTYSRIYRSVRTANNVNQKFQILRIDRNVLVVVIILLNGKMDTNGQISKKSSPGSFISDLHFHVITSEHTRRWLAKWIGTE